MDKRVMYTSGAECDGVTEVVNEWYSGLDEEARARVDLVIMRLVMKVKKLGEVGGRELIGKIILHLMREGAL